MIIQMKLTTITCLGEPTILYTIGFESINNIVLMSRIS